MGEGEREGEREGEEEGKGDGFISQRQGKGEENPLSFRKSEKKSVWVFLFKK